jgi:hypothetical protein
LALTSIDTLQLSHFFAFGFVACVVGVGVGCDVVGVDAFVAPALFGVWPHWLQNLAEASIVAEQLTHFFL